MRSHAIDVAADAFDEARLPVHIGDSWNMSPMPRSRRSFVEEVVCPPNIAEWPDRDSKVQDGCNPRVLTKSISERPISLDVGF